MKAPICFLVFTLLYLTLASAQTPYIKKWDKTYGGTEPDLVTTFIRTGDGGFMAGGFSFSDSSGNKSQDNWGGTTYADFWLVKTDSLGQKQWDRNYGGLGTDVPSEILIDKGGGYMLLGSSNSIISGDKTQPPWGTSTDYWLVKIDAAGNKIWDRRYGGTGDDYGSGIVRLPGGGYVLAGTSQSVGIGGDKTQANWGSSDFWVVRIDAVGNLLWDRRFGATGSENLQSLLYTADGNLLLGGTSSSGIGGDRTEDSRGFDDYWIIKIDTLGNKIWDKRYGGNQSDELNAMLQTPDGGFLLSGNSSSLSGPDKSQSPFGNYDFWVLKINSTGQKLWDKIYGGTDKEEQEGTLIRTFDGNYVISGSSYSPISGTKTEANLGFEQAWFQKFDSLGNVIHDKVAFTIDHDEQCKLVESIDGCMVFALQSGALTGGYKTAPSWGGFYFDYWMVKLCDTTLAPVPVKLISFSGKASGDQNILYWKTEMEIHNDYFTLLRSNDGNNFQPIAKIPGAGNSTQPLNYSFVDTDPFAGISYYILQQTDFDGNNTSSKIISIKNTSAKVTPLVIAPNPARNEIIISGINFQAGDEIKFINTLGKVIYMDKIPQEGSNLKISVSNFPTGMYVLKVGHQNKIYSKKFLKE